MARGAGPDRDELSEVLRLVSAEAERYLADLDGARVRLPEADETAESLGGDLPETGDGAVAALTELLEHSAGLIASSGPRYFHFVTGGVSPAALGADWLASVVDQNNGDWVGAPLASQLEAVSIRWLLGSVRAPSRLGRRPHDRRDDGELRGPRRGAAMVGAPARAWTSTSTGSRGCRAPACSRPATCIRATRRRSRCSASVATA